MNYCGFWNTGKSLRLCCLNCRQHHVIHANSAPLAQRGDLIMSLPYMCGCDDSDGFEVVEVHPGFNWLPMGDPVDDRGHHAG